MFRFCFATEDDKIEPYKECGPCTFTVAAQDGTRPQGDGCWAPGTRHAPKAAPQSQTFKDQAVSYGSGLCMSETSPETGWHLFMSSLLLFILHRKN